MLYIVTSLIFPFIITYFIILHYIAKEILLVAIMLIPVALILIRGQGNFLIDLVGFVYPAVKSIKLVDSGKTEGESMWITYWMIFSFLKVIEGFLDFFVMNIPFYPFGKAAFLVWCYHPSTRGAETVYSSVIKPHIVPLIVEVKKD